MSAAPASALPYPPIHKDKKFVVLSDWYAHLVHLFTITHRHRIAAGMARSLPMIPMTVRRCFVFYMTPLFISRYLWQT